MQITKRKSGGLNCPGKSIGAVAIYVGIEFGDSVNEVTASGGEVNDLIGSLVGEALPTGGDARRKRNEG